MRYLLHLIAVVQPLLSMSQWTYTGTYLGIPIPLDSVLVENLSQDGFTVVPGDDLGHAVVGIEDHFGPSGTGNLLLPGHPNPFHTSTSFSLSLVKANDATLLVFDATGRRIAYLDAKNLAPGLHDFQFMGPHQGVYFVSCAMSGERHAIRLVQLTGNGPGKLLHVGSSPNRQKSGNRDQFQWAPGDSVRHTAYATLANCGQARYTFGDRPGPIEYYTVPLALQAPGSACLILDRDSITLSSFCFRDTSDVASFLLAGEGLQCNTITVAENGFIFSLDADGAFVGSIQIAVNDFMLDTTRLWVRANPQQALLQSGSLELSCLGAIEELLLKSIADPLPNPGGAVSGRIWCGHAGLLDLFTLLDGSQSDSLGNWTASVGDILDGHYWNASGRPSGSYTFSYTVEHDGCTDSVTTSVLIHPSLNAGNDSALSVCSNADPFQLWEFLGGSPDPGGSWIGPNGDSFAYDFLFDPVYHPGGTYWYIRRQPSPPPCNSDTAAVVVTINPAPYAGLDGNLTVCNTGGPVPLSNGLGGTPHTSGTWSGPSPVLNGQYDPSNMNDGVYNYIVTGTTLCPSDTARVTVTESTHANAGSNGIISVCASDPAINLFEQLGDDPDPNGDWSGPSPIVNGMYDPQTMDPGQYTYTVTTTPPCPGDSATVLVNEHLCPTLIVDPPSLNFDTVCVGLSMQWYQHHIFALSGVDLAQGPITFGPVPGVGFTESPIGILQPNLTLQWDGGTGPIDSTLFVGFSPATSGPFSINVPISGGGATTTLTLTGVGSSAAPVAHLTGIAQDPENTGQAILRGSYEDVGCSPVSSMGFEVSSDPSFEPHETYYASGDATLFTGPMPIQPSTTYWIRAFVQYNFIQKAYSAPISWTSPDGTTPTLNVSNTDVNVGSYCVGGRTGFSIFLSGQHLTAGVVEIGSSAGTFEFSLNMSEYTPTLTLVIQQDGTIPGTEVHVRATVPNEGPWTGSVSIAGGGATSTINVHGEGSTQVPEFIPVFPPSPDQINIMTAFSDGAPYAVINFGEPLSCGTESVRVEYSTIPGFQLGTGISPELTSQPFGYQAVVYDLLPGTRYYVVAAAESAQGQGTTDHYTFLTPLCPNSVPDRDGTTYSVIRIGDQCWTGENLRVTQYNNGTPIPHVSGNATWIQQTAGAWCNYGNNASNDMTYGKLYNWYSASNGNLCPSGWHVPTDDDWQEMEAVIGVPSDMLDNWGFDRGSANNAGGKLKATSLWISPNLGANNISAFSALPGGYRFGGAVAEGGNQPGGFYSTNETGWWWSSSAFTGDQGHVPPIPSDANKGWVRLLINSQQGISRFDGWKESGFSVRCVKD